MPEEQIDLYKRHVSIMKTFPGYHIPKVHMMAHILKRQTVLGSFRLYATWLDESLNKDLKAACRYASQLGFEARVLDRMVTVLRRVPRLNLFAAPGA